jgi:phage-related protein
LTEAANETAKVGKVTGPLADALTWAGVNASSFDESLEACSTEAERQTLIMETLNGLYADAATKYQETNAEVIRANQANEEWADVMAEVGGAVEPVLSDIKLLGASMLQELVPGVTEVTEAFRALLNGEEGAEADLGQAVGDMLGDIIEKAVELLPTIIQTGVSLIVSLAEAIVAELPGLVSTLTQVLVDNIPVLLEGATSLLLAVVDAIDLILPPLIEALPVIIVALVEGLVSAIPDLIEGAVTLLNAIILAIPLLIQQLMPHVPTIVDSIIDGLLDALPLLVDGAVELLLGILSAIPEIQKAMVENAPSIVESICEGLLSAIPELVKAGGELLSGLVKGMMDFDIAGSVKSVGKSVVKGFKNAFDIHSPSRLIADEIGEPVAAGLAQGIEENADAPIDALETLTNDMIDGAESLNGLTLERRVTHAFDGATPAPMEGLGQKLDQILAAIKSGQVIMLDGKTFIGSTASGYDRELGQRRVLAERGAI